MPPTVFGTEIRVLLCDNCNAPLQADSAGGLVTCQYCNAANQFATRDDTSTLAPPGGAKAVSDEERLSRLRAQDGKPLLPPASLQGLFSGGQLPAWKLNEALAVWKSSKTEARTTGNFEAAERMLFLTMALVNVYASKNEPLNQRALLEGALDAASLPRHRQVLRGYLSRFAARDGDLRAAEAWLAPCDPRSDDLEADTAYRFSRAYIDTARGDYAAVLRALGAQRGEVPIMDVADAVCGLLRANAVERSGNVEGAVALLAQEMGEGPAARQVLGEARAYHASLRLCELSFPRAEAQYATVAGKAAAASSGGGIGGILYIIGLVLLGLGGLSVACGVAASFGPFGFIGGVGGFSAAPGLLITGAILALIGRSMKKSAARAERLRLHGLQGKGTVLGFSPTGTEINNVPQVSVRLKVELEGRAPYEAATRLLAPPQVQMQLAPGTMVAVRVDPENLNDLVIETD